MAFNPDLLTGRFPGMPGGLRVAEPPRNLNLDPMIPVLRRILTEVDFIGPLKTGVDCIDSSPLVNVCLVSLKSLPYAFYGDNKIVQNFDNAISCRLRYLEAAVISTASLVYNVVFGVVFTALSLVTLGQVKVILDQMRKHWTHSALATAAAGIATIGTVSPEWGVKANAAGLFAIGVAIVQWMQGDVIEKFVTAYQHNARELKNATRLGLQADVGFYDRQFVPFFNFLDQNLNDRVQTFSDLIDVGQRAMAVLPSVVPTATTDVITDNAQILFSNWSGETNRARSGARGPVTGMAYASGATE